MNRRDSITTLLALGAAGISSGVCAQAYPAKRVRWIVPYAPGGFVDTRSRQLAMLLGELWKQPVLVDNRPGGGGVIGTELVVRAPADGYTLGMGSFPPLAANVSLMKSLPYDPLRDLAHVVLVEKSPLVLMVHPSVRANTVAEFVTLVKANPGKFSFGSSGIGGMHHLAGEMFRQLAGIDISHVPYKGGAPATTDLLAGHIKMMFELTYAALPSVKAGRLRPLAVTAEGRLPMLPDVPTFAESGYPTLVLSNWQGVIAPRETPRALIDQVNQSVNQLLTAGAVRDSILGQGNETGGGRPESFTALIRAEIPRWRKVVEDAKIQPV
jgi:tripartite-type tricarboxylate transporter receptor subunit TctC